MCGICGVHHLHADAIVAESTLRKMTEVITHRGPDDAGFYIHKNIGLGFRRLSIVDLGYGHQPMSNEDDQIWIIFNGEIYNHKDLRQTLMAKGHKYKNNTDTETIIHLYEEEGLDGFQRMNGMFGFAIWDGPKRRLVVVRDRLGVKPLHYFFDGKTLVFGSEIKSLLEHPLVPKQANEEVIEEYLTYRFAAGRQTMFKNIFNVLPGHMLIVENGELQERKYWDLPLGQRTPANANAQEQLEELLADSVHLRLMADVPLGTMCSGGMDSGLTTAYAALQSDIRFNTYSVGFAEKHYDERRYAKMVADRYNTAHHDLQLNNRDFADLLPEMIWHLDEPLNHANSVPIYSVCKLAKEKVTVLLTGEGADELFLGYPRYLIPSLLSRMPLLQSSAAKALAPLLACLPSRKARKLAKSFGLSLDEAILTNSAFVPRTQAQQLLSPDVPRSSLAYRHEVLETAAAAKLTAMETLSYLELKTYLVSILHRMDKMTMAASLEGRVPFLDFRLVEWSWALPLEHKIHGLTGKHIVKTLAKKMLPHEVIHRPKSGFGLPLAEWFRDPVGLGRYLDLLRSPRFRERGWYDTVTVERLVREHLACSHDHSEILWELINLELWQQKFSV